MITTTNPRRGVTSETTIRETESAEVARQVDAAQAAAPGLERIGREGRAAVLDALAAELENRREHLVEVADSETGLSRARLESEIARSASQARLFGEALREGSYLEAMVDEAAGVAPEIRRMLVPIGPVVRSGMRRPPGGPPGPRAAPAACDVNFAPPPFERLE